MTQRQPSPQQIEAAQRILSHNHTRTYAPNAKGATIRALQIFLASKGYEVGRLDGNWGKKTQAAFTKFEADRGTSFGRATPKALKYISGEMGQPLPRARPEPPPVVLPVPRPPQPGDMPPIGMDGSAAAMGGAPAVNAGMAAADVPPAPVTPDPNQSQSAEREYDPNVLHAAVMNRNEPADLAGQPMPAPMPAAPPPQAPQIPASDPGDISRLPGTLGMENAPEKFAAARSMAPRGFDATRFDEAAPMTSDTGVPDNLVENMASHQPGGPAVHPLTQALIQSGQFPGRPEHPGKNEMNILEALRLALMNDPRRMAGR